MSFKRATGPTSKRRQEKTSKVQEPIQLFRFRGSSIASSRENISRRAKKTGPSDSNQELPGPASRAMSNSKILMRGHHASVYSHPTGTSRPTLPRLSTTSRSSSILHRPLPPVPARVHNSRPRNSRRRKLAAYAAYKAKPRSLLPIPEEPEVLTPDSHLPYIHSPQTPLNHVSDTSTVSPPPSRRSFRIRMQDPHTLKKKLGSSVGEYLRIRGKSKVYETLCLAAQHRELATSPQSGPQATSSYLPAAANPTAEEAEYLSPVMLDTPCPKCCSSTNSLPLLRRRPSISPILSRLSSRDVRSGRSCDTATAAATDAADDLSSRLQAQTMPDTSSYRGVKYASPAGVRHSSTSRRSCSCGPRHPASFSCVRPAVYEFLKEGC
jgi:hypothetical protein